MSRERDRKSFCPACNIDVGKEETYLYLKICSKCQHHFPLTANERIVLTLDENSFSPMAEGILTEDPLVFPDYMKKIENDQKKTSLEEAVVIGTGTLDDIKVVIGVMDTEFRMGSMGSVVGEKIVRAIQHATMYAMPLILFCGSGGARMQEGIFSLMQMARTATVLSKFHLAGGFYVSVLTHPTTGGVTASFATLGDIIVAEPNALIGFAGPRVIAQTIREELPEGFQRAEFLLGKGFIDLVISREELRNTLVKLVQFHKGEGDHG